MQGPRGGPTKVEDKNEQDTIAYYCLANSTRWTSKAYQQSIPNQQKDHVPASVPGQSDTGNKFVVNEKKNRSER